MSNHITMAILRNTHYHFDICFHCDI